MADKNQKNLTELTPATLENMPITQKITAYEQILSDQARYAKELEGLEKKANTVLEPAGKTFSTYMQKSDIRIPKKRNVNPTINAFAQRIGKEISSVIANGTISDTTLKDYIGEESFIKLKGIADEYSIQAYGSKEIDEKASEKVWQEYTKVRDDYQVAHQRLEDANRRMEQANQYVSYVQKLAEVASKTKRLMQ